MTTPPLAHPIHHHGRGRRAFSQWRGRRSGLADNFDISTAIAGRAIRADRQWLGDPLGAFRFFLPGPASVRSSPIRSRCRVSRARLISISSSATPAPMPPKKMRACGRAAARPAIIAGRAAARPQARISRIGIGAGVADELMEMRRARLTRQRDRIVLQHLAGQAERTGMRQADRPPLSIGTDGPASIAVEMSKLSAMSFSPAAPLERAVDPYRGGGLSGRRRSSHHGGRRTRIYETGRRSRAIRATARNSRNGGHQHSAPGAAKILEFNHYVPTPD